MVESSVSYKATIEGLTTDLASEKKLRDFLQGESLEWQKKAHGFAVQHNGLVERNERLKAQLNTVNAAHAGCASKTEALEESKTEIQRVSFANFQASI